MLLSLDVGFRNMGWSLFDDQEQGLIDCGVITTKKSQDKKVRYTDDYFTNSQELFQGLSELVEKNAPIAIIGELPHGGGQNARALAQMMSAVSIVSGVSFYHDILTAWCSPTDVKVAVTGKKSATKLEIMLAIAEKFNIPVKTRKIGCRKTKKFKDGFRTEHRFVFKDTLLNEGRFEHIADSCGAYLALRNSPICTLARNLTRKDSDFRFKREAKAA